MQLTKLTFMQFPIWVNDLNQCCINWKRKWNSPALFAHFLLRTVTLLTKCKSVIISLHEKERPARFNVLTAMTVILLCSGTSRCVGWQKSTYVSEEPAAASTLKMEAYMGIPLILVKASWYRHIIVPYVIGCGMLVWIIKHHIGHRYRFLSMISGSKNTKTSLQFGPKQR
jgi:hypothetical protein